MGSDREQKLMAWLSGNGYEKASIADLSGMRVLESIIE